MADREWPSRTAVEVVREGRFRYVVVERMSNGFDTSWEPNHFFRWTAARHARRLARTMADPVVVMRIPTGPTP